MTSHPFQISNILALLASLNGGYAPSLPSIDAVTVGRPRYHVKQIKIPQRDGDHYQDEWFEVTLQATSETELETYIKALQNCSTERPTGWHKGDTITLDSDLTLYTDNYNVSLAEGLHTIGNKAGGTTTCLNYEILNDRDPGYLPWFIYICQFPIPEIVRDGGTVTSLYLKVTPSTNATGETVTIFGMNVLTGYFDVGFNIMTHESTANDSISGNWVTNTEKSSGDITDILQELLTAVPTASYLPLRLINTAIEQLADFYIKDVANTNPTKDPHLVWTYTYPTAYPYYIDVKLQDKIPTEGIWRATLRVNARWTL